MSYTKVFLDKTGQEIILLEYIRDSIYLMTTEKQGISYIDVIDWFRHYCGVTYLGEL